MLHPLEQSSSTTVKTELQMITWLREPEGNFVLMQDIVIELVGTSFTAVSQQTSKNRRIN